MIINKVKLGKDVEHKIKEGCQLVADAVGSTMGPAGQNVIRDNLQKFLSDNGVGVGLHYPIPCHLQSVYFDPNDIYDLPNTEELASTLLSLPMHPDVSEDDVKFICDKIKEFFDSWIWN